jgi:hypothetical protein
MDSLKLKALVHESGKFMNQSLLDFKKEEKKNADFIFKNGE